MAKKPSVNVRNFSLKLGGKQIVRDLSFDVYPGETFAFLGANGSGKTSTIRCLLGIYSQPDGTLHIDGRPYSPDMADRVGYLPEERGLYTRSRVLDIMTYFGELKGMNRHDARDFSLEYLDSVGISQLAQTKIKKLSGGQQQKVQLGVAIMNKPKLLILDEPTKGLDPVNRVLLIDTIMKLKEQGTAVIYITHLMEEVERIADRLIIIRNGQRVAYGGVSQVKAEFSANSIEDVFVHLYEESPNVT
jgi:ABC-2 type transport system ATP-binding protein